MARYPLGAPVRVPTTVRTANLDGTPGALVDAGTLVLTVKLAAAGGTWTTTGTYATPTHDGTGLYHQDIPVTDLATIGHYQYTWVSTGTGAGVSVGDFDVFDPFEGALLSLQDAKAHLNETGTAVDDELARFIRAATELVETRVGPCTPRVFTSRVDDGTTQLVLPLLPLLSVTSVTSVYSWGPTYVTADLDVDTAAGIIALTTGGVFWGGPWNVAGVAGRAQSPERFVQAAREQVRHLWDTQRGSAPPSVLQGEEIFTTSAGFTFSIPRRVIELLAADMVPVL